MSAPTASLRPVSLARSWVSLRCPACRAAPIFRSGFEAHPTCGSCGVRFERWPGTWLMPPVLGYGTGGLAAAITGLVLAAQGRFGVSSGLVMGAVGATTALVCFRHLKALWIHVLYLTGWVYADRPGEAVTGSAPLRRSG